MLATSRARKKEEKKNLRTKRRNEITNFRYHMPFPRSLFFAFYAYGSSHYYLHVASLTSIPLHFFFSFFSGQRFYSPCRGLNEIVDNQQFVLFFFSFSPLRCLRNAGPEKKSNEDRQFLRKSKKKCKTSEDATLARTIGRLVMERSRLQPCPDAVIPMKRFHEI